MLDILIDKVKSFLSSRLFPIAVIYLVLFGVIINQVFVLQIVEGTTHAEDFNFRQTRTREIKSTRGNIYDRNGILLASNILTYTVTMEDSTSIKSNKERNEIIHRLINLIEKNGDTLDTEFFIRYNDETEEFEFTLEGAALNRFKRTVYSYVLENKKLTEEQQNATAQEVFEFLRYGIKRWTSMFDISDEYTIEETLKIMGVRYALFSNFPKHLQITVASNINEHTVAAIMESSAKLQGVEIQKQTHRVYHDSIYFAHMLGYTGLISAEELASFEEHTDYYDSTDVIGKLGLEKEFESFLGGTKGSEIVATNTVGKVIEVLERIDPIAGHDVYLTIDAELQKAAYHLLESRIAGVLLDKLQPDMNYGSKGESASDILIPIYEVYYALFNNNIISISRLNSEDATDLERQVYNKFNTSLNHILDQFDSLLAIHNTTPNNRAGNMEEYLDYFYRVLIDNNVIVRANIPTNDSTFQAYHNKQISLSALIQHAIANNWIDLSKLNIGTEYYSADELYYRLITYNKNRLFNDSTFHKRIIRNLIFSNRLSGTEISLLLFDQGVLEYNEEDFTNLRSGRYSPYQFMRDKITSLEITPGMLALEPSSGSLVVTDVRNGDVLAMVTYPSYDNNMLANRVDPAYYSKLLNDRSKPLLNRPTQQRTAPGSTFKMVTSIAGLEERVVTASERILDLGEFTKTTIARCHSFPRSHGAVDVIDALKVSCNYYYYEIGYRLSLDSTGKFRDKLGIDRIAKYATMLGLDQKSGVEVFETNPLISTNDAIRSSIGQGSNDFTPIQLARYITTLANRGINYDLTLLDRIVDKNGQVVLNNSATINHDSSELIKPSTWDSVQRGLYAVVNTPGGSSTNLYRNLGITVAGKTGTSQISKVNLNNALFVSYAPYENPEISVTAVIPNGDTSRNAAALSKDIYTYYYRLQDEQQLLTGEVILPETNIAGFAD